MANHFPFALLVLLDGREKGSTLHALVSECGGGLREHTCLVFSKFGVVHILEDTSITFNILKAYLADLVVVFLDAAFRPSWE